MYVVVTRQGYGDLWSFKTYAQADEHPLYQFGDPILHSGQSVARNYNRLEMPGLLTRLGKPAQARAMEAEFANLDAVAQGKRLVDYGELAWRLIQEQAVEPPIDPATICKQVSIDRRKTKQKDFIMAKAKLKAEDQLNEDGTAAEAPEGEAAPAAKKPRAKKEKAEGSGAGRTRIGENAVISLNSDKEGNKYSAENNPKRPGSSSHGRFALYVDGMTVKEAIEAGLRRDDITWDVNKGYLTLSAA
jgi:hypothetical protein